MIWVTAEDVVAIHSRIIQVSGGIDGLRDRAGLEAAIAAPLQSFGGEDLFPTDIEKIARIGLFCHFIGCLMWRATFRHFIGSLKKRNHYLSLSFRFLQANHFFLSC